jgi:hypothetical protein
MINFIQIFLGTLDEKMFFTFQMYDFDGDGYITAEDVRIMMSYMPFNRNGSSEVQPTNGNKGGFSPEIVSSSPGKSPTRKREGLLEVEEGKNVDYNDRINDQSEIK